MRCIITHGKHVVEPEADCSSLTSSFKLLFLFVCFVVCL